MLKATGHHVIVEQTKVKKKAGLKTLDDMEFEIMHTDEKIAQHAVQYGVVISVGDTAWEAFGPKFTGRPWAKPGDTVFFPRYSGAAIEDPEEIEDRYFVLLNDEDIQVVIKPGDNPKYEMKEYTFNKKRESKA